MHHLRANQRKDRVAILISENVELKTRGIDRSKESHSIMISVDSKSEQ